MFYYGTKSEKELRTLSPGLQKTFQAVIKIMDNSIQCGHRGKRKQNRYFMSGASKVRFPRSKHNSFPSKGADVCPYPYTEDREVISYFAGIVVATGAALGVKIRWGGDWDQDNDTRDNDFDDLFHFEEVSPTNQTRPE